MSLFQKRKPLPLDRLSECELVESDTIIEGLGISKVVVSQDAEAARKRFREHLKKLVSRKSASKVWMFHILGGLYYEEGKLEEAAAMYSRAIQDYPADPRAYYSLGVIYYGLFEYAEPLREGVHWRRFPLEIQERLRRVQEFEEQNQLLVQAFRESKLTASPEEAAKLALKYFRKTLARNISSDDKSRVQTHMRLIEVHLGL